MKSIKLVILGILMVFALHSIQAQNSVNKNSVKAPLWGPSGYSFANYYYIPDIETYYDIRKSQFIFLKTGLWTQSKSLPLQYKNYDLNKGYKVVLNEYLGSSPFTAFKFHKETYYKGYYGGQQLTIGNRNKDH
jgi:hypothetical protein